MTDVKQGGVARTINNVAVVTDVISKASLEIETLTAVIVFLTGTVESSDDAPDLDKDRDLKKKVTERFGDYESQIKQEYGLLLVDFGDKFNKAWASVDVSEECISQVDSLLSIHSIRALSNNDNDPIKAIDELVEWLKSEIGKNVKQNSSGYSESAIRFFIYKEFARCNIFPNLK